MNSNSFILKGWTVTIVTAVCTLAYINENTRLGYLSFICIFVFWMLDGFYLSQERKFRTLYIEVAKKNEEEIDFTMDTTNYNILRNNWIRSILSKTILPFYFLLTIISLAIICW